MLPAKQVRRQYLLWVLSTLIILLVGMVLCVLNARKPGVAYWFRLKGQRAEIQVFAPDFFRPAIGPEGIRIWYTEGFSFQVNDNSGTVKYPMLNGEHNAVGEISFNISEKTVSVNLSEDRWSKYNGHYDLVEFDKR